MKFRLLPIFFLTLVLVACRTYTDEQKADFNSETRAFVKKKGWKMKEEVSGLFTEVLTVGTGTDSIRKGSEVSLSYTGKLKNGRVFDITNPDEPLKININELIQGFQIGLQGKTVGTKMRLVVPPHLGYGDHVLDDIPPNSILIFEVKVLEVK